MGQVIRDVSDHKHLEEDLAQSEAYFRALIENSLDLIVVLDKAGIMRFQSPSSERILGFRPEELVGQSVFAFVHPDDLGASGQAFARLLQGQYDPSMATELRFRHKNGSWRVLEVMAKRLVNHVGEVSCVINSRDITERTQAEEALRESEERLRLALSAAGQGLWDLNPQTREGYASPELARLLGYRPEEFVNSSDLWESRVHPDDLIEAKAQFEACLAGEEPDHACEYRTRTASGEWKWVLDQGRVMERDPQGRPLRVIGITMDITERKEAEELLKLTQFSVERAADAIYWVGPEGRIILANEASCRRDGYSREEMLSLRIFDLDPSLTPNFYGVWWQDLKRAGSLALESTHRTKSGEVYPIELSANYIEIGGKEYNCVFARDISERKRAEEALRESEEQLRQAQKMEAVGQLAGGIAHDFNNLLTSIIGNSSLALGCMAPEDPNRELIADVQEVGERAAVLTRQILAFSRRQVLKPEILCLNKVILDLEPLLRRTLGEDVELEFLLAPDLRESEIDAQQMGQVLLNLTANARDAMPEGGRLLIETTNASLDRAYSLKHLEVEAGDYVMLAVSDTGCGMDKKTQAHVFEPFFTTKEVGKGTGLGLSTAFGIVKQSGGSISVYSEPGEGSTFKVYLPVAEASASPQVESAEGQEESRPRCERILVVEDEAHVRELVVRVLSRSGYRVMAVGSAKETEQVLEEPGNQPDLLLTDVVLPGGVNGRQVAETLLARFPDLRVLFMSGYTRNAVVHDGRLGQGLAILEKPFTPKTLLEKVREVLDAGATRAKVGSV